MKRKKLLSVIGIILVLAMLITACSKKEDKMQYDTSTAMPEETAEYGNTSDANGDYKGSDSDMVENDSGEGITVTTTTTSQEVTVEAQDKIIRTFYLDVETQEFDSLITNVNAEIKRLQGYVESSKINGKGYYNNQEIRYGSIVARIPSDKVDEFVGTVNEKANVVSQQESSENVSLKYIEAKSHIETLRIEQERLYAILEQELNLENIITLESRLSNIRYELENYESKLRYYDNQVAYSTVTLSISEVEKLTEIVETRQTLGDRIATGFGDTMYEISQGFQNFIVWFVVNLPYLILWGIIIAIIVIVVRRYIKKSNERRATQPTPPALYNSLRQDSNQQNESSGKSEK